MLPLLNVGVVLLFTYSHHVKAGPPYGSNDVLTYDQLKYLVAFGDSYTYVQGTYGRQNYSFIGGLFDFSYTPEQLLADHIVQNLTGTAEGGSNYVEFLTKCGVKPGLTLPRSCDRQLWDFAYAGTPLHHNHTVSFVNQIKQYVEYGHKTVSKIGGRDFFDFTLVNVWIGINDVSDTAKYTNVTFPEFYAEITSTIFDSLSSLYDLGYYNYITYNLPPLDKSPGNVFSANPAPNAQQVSEWNTVLNMSARAWAKGHPRASVRLFDAHKVLQGVLDDPAKYGINNSTGACAASAQPDILTDPGKYGCLPLYEYFWYNSGHLTSHTHEIMASALQDFLKTKELYGP